MRPWFMLLALLALGACTAEQIGRTAQSACRSNPAYCTDSTAPQATPTPGL